MYYVVKIKIICFFIYTHKYIKVEIKEYKGLKNIETLFRCILVVSFLPYIIEFINLNIIY